MYHYLNSHTMLDPFPNPIHYQKCSSKIFLDYDYCNRFENTLEYQGGVLQWISLNKKDPEPATIIGRGEINTAICKHTEYKIDRIVERDVQL